MQATVWVEREPLLFERRKVKLGLEQDGRVQIRDGLEPGEQRGRARRDLRRQRVAQLTERTSAARCCVI